MLLSRTVVGQLVGPPSDGGLDPRAVEAAEADQGAQQVTVAAVGRRRQRWPLVLGQVRSTR